MDIKRFETGAVRSRDADMVRFDLITPIGLRRLAETYAEGAAKYGANNWKRGIPASDLINHVIRHIYLWLSGDRAEDHLAHAAWGLMTTMHFEETRPELIDCCLGEQEDAGKDTGEDAGMVLLDMDGVLVDFIGGIVREFGLGESTRGYISRQFGTDSKCPWNLAELFPTVPEEDLYAAFTMFFWADLAPTPWFQSLVLAIDDVAPGRAHLCTSAGYLGGEASTYFVSAVTGKEKWIMRHLPDMSKKTIFAYDKSPMSRGNLLIDDSDVNVALFDDAILCPAPWNSNHEIYWEGDDAVCSYLLGEIGKRFK